MRNTSQQEKDKKKKKRESELESFIFSLMEKSMKKALDAALDDLLKDWKHSGGTQFVVFLRFFRFTAMLFVLPLSVAKIVI